MDVLKINDDDDDDDIKSIGSGTQARWCTVLYAKWHYREPCYNEVVVYCNAYKFGCFDSDAMHLQGYRTLSPVQFID